MRVLITGGAGFIGSHLVEHFQGKAEVRILDNLRTGSLQNLEGFEYDFIQGSVTDRNTVRNAVQDVDLIFHLAALISVPESMEHPSDCEEINTHGTLYVLEEAARAGVTKCCFSSSAAIYGDNPEVPKHEGMTPEPKSPYAETKLEGEIACEAFQKDGRLQTACLRYFNVFGPRQDPGSAYAAAVPIFIDQALRGEDLTLHGDGKQTRDFIYVKDIVAANVSLAMHPEHDGVYNVGYGTSISIHDLAKQILHLSGSSSDIRFGPERPGDVKHSTASNQRLLDTGWIPESNFDTGLTETIRFFQKR